MCRKNAGKTRGQERVKKLVFRGDSSEGNGAGRDLRRFLLWTGGPDAMERDEFRGTLISILHRELQQWYAPIVCRRQEKRPFISGPPARRFWTVGLSRFGSLASLGPSS